MTDQELLQAIGQVVGTKLEPIQQDICALKEDVQGLKESVHRLETRMDRLETRMGGLETRIDGLETRIDGLETRMGGLETRMGGLETRIDGLETRIDGLETQLDKLDTRTDKLEETVCGIRIYMENDQQRTLNLLLEGQQALWDRFVPHEEYEHLKDRTEVLEATVRRHSQEIRKLQLA